MSEIQRAVKKLELLRTQGEINNHFKHIINIALDLDKDNNNLRKKAKMNIYDRWDFMIKEFDAGDEYVPLRGDL